MITAVVAKDVSMKHLVRRMHSRQFCYRLDFIQKNTGNMRQEKWLQKDIGAE